MKYWLIVFLLFISLGTYAQIGGNSTYEFLRIPNSARITALGGSLITVRDADLNLAYHNPAALNPSMHRRIAFNQSAYMGGVTHGYLAYGHYIDQGKVPVMVHAGLQYISYGKFQNRDVTGTYTGETSAAEYAINIGAGYQISKFLSVGANAKTILSYLGSYNSTGMAFDAAAMFSDTAKKISLTVAFKNMGTQFSTYARNGNMEPLPFDLQIGFAHRLKYIPLRFSVIMHNIQQWGIVYDDPSQQDNQVLLTGNEDQQTDNSAIKVVDDIFRHFIFNMELLFGKKGKPEVFRVAVGYNHMRRGELLSANLSDIAGFSFGCGLRIKQFQLDYGFGGYHFAGSAHHFSLAVNLDAILKGAWKKKK
ncbi:type IX secretion system protein PorQ [Aureispira anguillae]|uniref:Type IX secretion system protein PorQ n=1 Tax=Aureispira anguillae TaxID=2864201 RepID=A0A915YIC6_9BACT|nr:type IX secretion system protein PorQ [Aureispira anguillae]BDS13738.1 type IX secretion system protein PorQ [Aureispira anguillae]